MPRSHGVIKVEVWEARSEFRALTLDAQWTYAMLISQPQINNLGVLPYLPEKWSRLATDLNDTRLTTALTLLEDNRFTITDESTRELLVRTFIRHDAVWKQPTLITNARRLWRETESSAIADYLAERHPWLLDDGWTKAKIEQFETRKRPPETPRQTPPETPLDDEPDLGDSRPLTRGVRSPRARAQEGLPHDHPQDQGLPPRHNSEAVTQQPVAARATNERPRESTHIKTTIAESLRQARGATA